MGKQKTTAAVANRPTAAQKHKKAGRQGFYEHRQDHRAMPKPDLVAKPVAPKLKYQSYFEFQENTDKKKKLEFQVTKDKTPQPGFTFVPVGNPELTNVCKELSREEDALIFIVSNSKEQNHHLGAHVHRIGYHFRSYIVDQAMITLGGEGAAHDGPTAVMSDAEAIPETQEEINKQADAALRDLYPRIPNTDREMIIQHAFQKGAVFQGKAVVGLQAELTLSRRVQLAVIAHIRHTHTRYDQLLRETDYQNARRTVEGLCLDILLKWRGDEETGRDQLDEVLREVVVISDSEEEDDDEDSDEEKANSDDDVIEITGESRVLPAAHSQSTTLPSVLVPKSRLKDRDKPEQAFAKATPPATPGVASRTRSKTGSKRRQKAKRERREHKRYQAWSEAQKRVRQQPQGADFSINQAQRLSLRQDRGSPQDMLETRHAPRYTNPAYHNERDGPVYVVDGRHSRNTSREDAESEQIRQASPFMKNQLEQSRREGVLVRHRPTDLNEYEHVFEYPPRETVASRLISPLRRSFPPQMSSEEPKHRGHQIARDVVLPSIEGPVDLTGSSPASSRYHRPIYPGLESAKQEVMYSQHAYDRESEHSRVVPSRPTIVYVDQHEMPKRRRVMVESDPISNFSSGGDIVRLISRPGPERQVATSHATLIRDRSELRGSHPNGSEYRVLPASQLQFVEHRPEQKSSMGNLSLDDSRDQANARQPYRNEPRLIAGHGLHEDQHLYDRVVVGSSHGPLRQENEWPPERIYSTRAASQMRPPQDLQGRAALDVHNLPSSSRSDERRNMSALASQASHYPVLSRTQAEDESRLSFARQEFRTVDSHQVHLPQERFAPNMAPIHLPREQGARPAYRVDDRFQPRYIEVSSENGREPGMTRRSPGAPQIMAAPVYVRTSRRPDDVILLE